MAGIWAAATDVLAFLQAYNGAVTALATIAIGFFTLALVWVTNRQARLTRAALELGNTEFIATHRPRLRVRRFMCRLSDKLPVAVHFIVVNVGESAAHIKGFDVYMNVQAAGSFGTNPQIAPMELQTLAPGQAALYIATTPELTYLDEWGISRNVPGSFFEFRGEIEYADDLGVSRRTGFWRVRGTSNRMVPRNKEDPDYEYED